MNTVNIPGFTAECSFFTEKGSYCLGGGGNGSEMSIIIPQLPGWFKCGLAMSAQLAACASAITPACVAATITAMRVCGD